MNSRSINLLLLLHIFVVVAYAQAPKPYFGKVLNQGTKEAIAGATLLLPQGLSPVATDTLGNFYIKQLPAGEYTIQVRAVGYRSTRVKVKVNAEQVNLGSFYLEPSQEMLQTVEIYGRKEKSYANSKSFIGSKTETKIIQDQ